MKKVYFVIFFVLNFLGLFATSGSSVEVSTTLKLINSSKMESSKTFINNKKANFYIEKFDSDKIKVSVKEMKAGKVQLTNLAGEKVLVDLKSNISQKDKEINGKLVLGSTQEDLKGKVTLRVMYN